MALAQTTRVTAEDYRLMPEAGPRYQLIEGELTIWPSPNRYHQDISGKLEFILLKYLERNPVGKLYDAPFDVYLTEHNVFQPDIVFIANDRTSTLTDAGAEGAPTLVIEILSDRTAQLDKNPKRKAYAAAGVPELWLVNPETKSIEVYRLQQDAEHPTAVFQEKDAFTSPCFPGLSISATEVFKQ